MRLAKIEGGKGQTMTLTEKKLISGKGDGSERPELIIFGFIGGRFESDDGTFAKVTGVDLESTPFLAYFFQENDTNGGNEVEQEANLEEFIDFYNPIPTAGQSAW